MRRVMVCAVLALIAWGFLAADRGQAQVVPTRTVPTYPLYQGHPSMVAGFRGNPPHNGTVYVPPNYFSETGPVINNYYGLAPYAGPYSSPYYPWGYGSAGNLGPYGYTGQPNSSYYTPNYYSQSVANYRTPYVSPPAYGYVPPSYGYAYPSADYSYPTGGVYYYAR